MMAQKGILCHIIGDRETSEKVLSNFTWAVSLQSKLERLIYLSTKIIMVRHISAQYHLNNNWSKILPLQTGFKKWKSIWFDFKRNTI